MMGPVFVRSSFDVLLMTSAANRVILLLNTASNRGSARSGHCEDTPSNGPFSRFALASRPTRSHFSGRRSRPGMPPRMTPRGSPFSKAKIRPVLVEKCDECHSSKAKKPKGGLKVDSRAAIRAGGTSGPAVVPGDLDASLLYQAISAADGVEPMPPKAKLSPSVVADFRQWITMGAPDPREGTTDEAAAPGSPAKSRDWWSLKPLTSGSVPTVDSAMAHWA